MRYRAADPGGAGTATAAERVVDPEELWLRRRADFQDRHPGVEVHLRLAAQRRDLLRPITVRDEHRRGDLLEVTAVFGDLRHAAAVLWPLLPDVEVLAPPSCGPVCEPGRRRPPGPSPGRRAERPDACRAARTPAALPDDGARPELTLTTGSRRGRPAGGEPTPRGRHRRTGTAPAGGAA
ncbi:hypothetical protein [Pseudonocardia sp. NPDC046786]|uniref:hypothetical protein n=1 Tax=Pseudonocardia sp. NPDC046786 TaxID=3155471 RepID=UPI0033CB43E3